MSFIDELQKTTEIKFIQKNNIVYFDYKGVNRKIEFENVKKSPHDIKKYIEMICIGIELQKLCNYCDYNIQIHTNENLFTYSFFYDNDEFEYELFGNNLNNLYNQIRAQINCYERYNIYKYINENISEDRINYICPNIMFDNYSNGGYIIDKRFKFEIVQNILIVHDMRINTKTIISLNNNCYDRINQYFI